jgi:hypothetical protein
MQIIELERDDWNSHCPASGRLVFTDVGEPNTPALRGSRCHEVPEEPMHLAEEQPLWDAHLKAQAAADDGNDVLGFLRSLERPNWVALRSPPATWPTDRPGERTSDDRMKHA